MNKIQYNREYILDKVENFLRLYNLYDSYEKSYIMSVLKKGKFPDTYSYEMVREVLDVILDLASQDRTMIIVTHEMAFAKAIADRVVLLDAGTIVEQSDPISFFESPKTERAKKFLSTFEYSKQ